MRAGDAVAAVGYRSSRVTLVSLRPLDNGRTSVALRTLCDVGRGRVALVGNGDCHTLGSLRYGDRGAETICAVVVAALGSSLDRRPTALTMSAASSAASAASLAASTASLEISMTSS